MGALPVIIVHGGVNHHISPEGLTILGESFAIAIPEMKVSYVD